jgi:hypothetical protein
VQRSTRSSKLTPWALRAYRLALYAYPAAFRRAEGAAMWQVFRDSYEEASARGQAAVLLLWLRTGADLFRSALPERIFSMRPTVVIAAVTTCITFVVSLLASLNLYLLEDGNPLTSAAYSASPLLRLSYDGAYLSALVAVVAVCGIVAYALVPARGPVIAGLGALALVVVLGGFGGLLVRYPTTFLVLFLVFAGLTAISLLIGQAVAVRLRQRLGERPALVVGACVSTAVALFANVLALVPHTVALNPVSHPLYMQGTIPGTPFNSLLIAMGLEVLTVGICALSILVALRPSAPGTSAAG